ncbi:MAG: hypothetical protein V1903_10275 [Bacteroidota bacterium]
MNIYLTGYIPEYFFSRKHTNFWPWSYLAETFRLLGYNAFHINAGKTDHKKPALYICWNSPDTIELISKYKPHRDSIIVQKLTSFDASPESRGREWTSDPVNFFREWHWPQYQKLDHLNDSGYRFYAFGAKTDTESFPEKKKIVDKYRERIFWIPWGTMTVSYHDIMKSVPITEGFNYDLAFVGSRWGTKQRGNISEWDTYLQPLIDSAEKSYIAGRGTKRGVVSVKEHVEALKQAALCPIIHATSWKVEKGIMDRFWTVFSLGRFGVTDNEGILSFYEKKDVVLAISPEEYIEKSIWYMKNRASQKPYIESAQRLIKEKYNQYEVWKAILSKIFSE